MLDELGNILCNSCAIRNNMNKQYKYTRISNSIQKKMTTKKSGKNLLEYIRHKKEGRNLNDGETTMLANVTNCVKFLISYRIMELT